MDRSGAARTTRDLVALLIGGLPIAAIVTLSVLPPLRPAGSGLGWLAGAIAAAVVAAAVPSVLAALVVGLRNGVSAAILLAGSSAAVAGGAIVVLADGRSPALALATAAGLMSAAGAAARLRRPRPARGRGRIALAVLVLQVAETAAVVTLLPATDRALELARQPLLWATVALSAVATIAWLGRGGVAAAILLAAGGAGFLADRGGSFESLVGLAALLAAQLAATAASIDQLTADAPTDEHRLPELAARMTDAVLRFDGQLQLRDWNQAAAGLLGLDAGSRGTRLEELLGISLSDLPRPDGIATTSESVGGLEVGMHRSDSGLTAVIRDPGRPLEAERLGQELRSTIEDLLRARRTIDLQRGELERSATVDPLTGVASRGAILERLRIEVAQARRYRHPLAVVLLDIDRFGELNRLHGIGGGDAILREVALRIRLRVREADALGRAGSDGFIAVLPHTDEAGAATFADALRHRVRQRPVRGGETEAAVTVSIGVATMRSGEDLDLDGLLARVQEALDSARAAGGDRIALDRQHGLARLEDRTTSTDDADRGKLSG